MSATDTATALSAAARHRLASQLRQLIGRPIAELRITRVRWDDGLQWVVLPLAAVVIRGVARGHREIPLAEGTLHRDIAVLVRDAFPHADWSRAQDYDVVTGVLREHIIRTPAALRGDAL